MSMNNTERAEQHRATPEQWDAVASVTGVYPGAWGDCLLELRSRVDALEIQNALNAANSQSSPNDRQIRSSAPDGSLVDDASMGDLEFLTVIKNYIEAAEKIVDEEWGYGRSIEELIKAGLMPQPIYSEVVQRINALQPRSSGTHQ